MECERRRLPNHERALSRGSHSILAGSEPRRQEAPGLVVKGAGSEAVFYQGVRRPSPKSWERAMTAHEKEAAAGLFVLILERKVQVLR